MVGLIQNKGSEFVLRTTYLVFIVIISLLMSSRELYTSPDDLDYVNSFARFTPLPYDVLLLSEPLWILYSEVMSSFLDPELCLRTTIFIANFLFLLSCTLLLNWNFLFVIILFIFNLYLATLFYYIQIRVGLAISIFLLLLHFKVRPVIAALICSTIHSSFIAMAFAAVGGMIFSATRGVRLLGLLYAISAILLVIFIDNPGLIASNIDLGRREGVYAFERISNFNFYLISFLQFFLAAPYIVQWIKNGDSENRYTTLFVAYFSIAILISMVNEAGIRLVAMANIFMMINLGIGAVNKQERLFLGLSALTQIFLVGTQFMKGDFGVDSWFLRWILILS